VAERFDVVVAGAGHNSLVAAAYLARAGLRCLVLEASQDIGGDTSSAELTLPGLMHDSCSAALPRALARVIESHGGVIRTRARVTGLVLEHRRCTGVETDTGEQYRADRAVLSTIHIKHLLPMAPAAAWGEDFCYGVDTWQAGMSMFVTHYATDSGPAQSGSCGRCPAGRATGCPSPGSTRRGRPRTPAARSRARPAAMLPRSCSPTWAAAWPRPSPAVPG
jgi:hypothetical protein